MVYFVLLFLCTVACLISKRNKKQQSILALLFFTFMMLLVGIRDKSVGVDSESYSNDLDFVKEVTIETYEPLYQLSINFVNEMDWSTFGCFMFLSFITYTLYAYAILKYSLNPILSVLVFMVSFVHLFPETMNNLRQGIAIMLLLCSYANMANRKIVIGAVFFLLALGFHMSSLIALPFYFICIHNFSRKKIVIILISTFIAGFIASTVFSMQSILPDLSFASEVFIVGFDKLSGYSDSVRVLNWAGLIVALTPLNLLCLLIIPKESDSYFYKYLFNFYFWGVVIGNIIMGVIPFGMRYLYVFLVVESIIFAYKYRNSVLLKYYLVFMILSYCIYLIALSHRTDPGMIIPYKLNPEFVRLWN